MNAVMPLLEEQVAETVEAYRKIVASSKVIDPAQFVQEATGDPGDVAAEIVDLASDQLGYVIDYNWDAPHVLRDTLYRVGYQWAQGMDEAKLARPFRSADVVL